MLVWLVLNVAALAVVTRTAVSAGEAGLEVFVPVRLVEQREQGSDKHKVTLEPVLDGLPAVTEAVGGGVAPLLRPF